MTTDYNQDGLRTENGKPNVKQLVCELNASCEHASDAYEQAILDENTRFCKWADQQDNGRKPDLVNDQPAKPWGGSSDTRIRLADEFVRKDVQLMKAVLRQGRLLVRGTESGDVGDSVRTQIYLDHLKNTRMRAEIAREGELAAQYRQTFGYTVMSVTWKQRWALAHETVTLEDLIEQSVENPMVLEWLSILQSNDREDLKLLAAQLVQMYPELERGEAYRQIQALKSSGQMVLPVRDLAENRPQWEALKVWRDAFCPLNTADAQSSRWWAVRATGSVTDVAEKAFSEGWSEEFIEAVQSTVGATVLDSLTPKSESSIRRETFRDTAEEMEGLCEWFYFYYRAIGPNGLPCVYRTVVSPHVGKKNRSFEDLHGPDGPLGYEHGMYPLNGMRAEKPDRMMVETRSVPGVLLTNQGEIKSMRDARIDHTELALRPPVIRPEREVGLPLTIKPMGEIGERRMQSLRFQTIPQLPAGATPLELEARNDAERYFARNRQEDPVGASLADQDLADDWAEELTECWRMTLALCQQFESEQVFSRIVGGRPQPFRISRAEIQGKFDLQVFFNTEMLDPTKMKEKTERLHKVYVPLDRYGVYNLAPVLRGLFAQDFPEYADEALRSVEQATEAELKDEQNNWGLMLAGTEPAMATEGQNFQMRLEWLTNMMATPGAQARLAAFPDSAELVQRRMQHLQFQVQQQVNADTGRVGVEPLAATAAPAA